MTQKYAPLTSLKCVIYAFKIGVLLLLFFPINILFKTSILAGFLISTKAKQTFQFLILKYHYKYLPIIKL